jgi:DNA-binding transcriptional regulator YhcF (GntR family)
MSREAVTTQEIQDAVFKRILSRQYAVGERLPSVRELAKELGANRNTVNRAYQLLTDLGMIEGASHARNGFVVKQLSVSKSRGELQQYFFAQAKQLVWQGFASGLSHDEVQSQLTRALDDVFELGRIRIAFFECNVQDSQDMGKYLSQMLQRDIHCGLLSELEDADNVEQFDLIITTFHHLSSVMQKSKRFASKVVGVDTRLSPDALLDIARLPKGRMGVVSTLPSTAQMLQHILYSYYPDREIESIVVEDKKTLKQLSRRCDHLLVTHTCAEEVHKVSKRKPDVVIHFQVDQHSLQFLDKRIHEMQLQKTQGVRNVSAHSVFQLSSQAN